MDRWKEAQGKRNRARKIGGIKRGVFILPSIFTSLSFFFGFYSIVSTFNGHFEKAAWLIVYAAFCDALDGRVARLTRTVSRFGLEYDSLADVVSFGLAPGILIYAWALVPFGRVGWLAAFLYVICAALRLARFNVQSQTVESKWFQGIPTPVAAMMIATTLMFFYKMGIVDVKYIPVLLMTYFLALLMVSTVRYNSFKEFDLAKRKPFSTLVVAIFLLILVGAEPQIMLFSLSLVYTLSGPINAVLSVRRKVSEQKMLKEEEFS
jgi:CDP-diacylglycerol--serine O-phosphatidyltransferase